MDASNPKRLLAASGGGIWESRSGNSYTSGIPAGSGGWKAISNVLSPVGSSDNVTGMVIGPPGETGVVFAMTSSGYIIRSTDTLGATRLPGGIATWTNITGNLPRAVGTRYPGWDFLSSIAFNPWNIDEAWVSTTYTGPGTARVWHTMHSARLG